MWTSEINVLSRVDTDHCFEVFAGLVSILWFILLIISPKYLLVPLLDTGCFAVCQIPDKIILTSVL